MNVTAFYIEFVKVFFTSEADFSISPEENLGTHNLWFHWELKHDLSVITKYLPYRVFGLSKEPHQERTCLWGF